MARDFGTQLQGLYSFNHGIFVRNRKFIQFVTWLKKNFQDRTKIDEDIDKFDEDVLMMNCPSSAMAHLIFDRLEQFFDGFDRNFASLVLDSFPQFVKGLSFPSTIVHSLFEDSPVLFHEAEGGYSPQILFLWNELDAVFLQNL